jgi:glyoxylase-like metal-dependent hydrolase (beta-lactamase superfamily II)
MVLPAERAQVHVGDTTLTYLPDGHGRLDPAVLFPASQPEGWATHAAYLDQDGRFPVSIGSFLVRTPERAILVDLGLGAVDFAVPDVATFHGGRLLASLAAEGLRPDDIDTVFFTHLHHDHVGWTSNVAPAPNAAPGQVVDGLTFPRARHLVSAAEWQHWKGTEELVGPDLAAVQTPLTAAIAFVDDGAEIAPGVRVLATPGHTPGHCSLEITDPTGRDERTVIVLGDVMHCQVQVTESSWSFLFDHDAQQATQTRERLLAQLEDPATILAGGHFAGHVFGRVLPPVARRVWASGR